LIGLFAVFAASARAGEVVGQLRNASTLGTVPEFDVRLTASISEGNRLDQTIATDGDGAFRFTDVPADTAIVYVLSTKYMDVEYVSRFFRFAPDAETLEAELEVYDLGDDPSVIKLNGHHYVIDIPPGATMFGVTEVLAIENRAVTSFRPQKPLGFPLPKGAADFEGLDGFENSFVADDSVFLASPIRPGRLEAAFRYRLPIKDPIHFEGFQHLPTDLVSVLVTPLTADVTADGIQSLGEVDLGGGLFCMRYGLPVPAPGSAFHLEIDAVVANATNQTFAWVLVGCILALFAFILSLRERGPATVSTAELDRLRVERDQRVRAVLRFDTAGEQTNGSGGEERATLVAQAVTVQELLDAAERAGERP
jgi:hypothetical protein